MRKKGKHVQVCKSQFSFLNILTVFIQNLGAFDQLTKNWNNNKAYERILTACNK